jgi:hypothetical protein
MNVRYFDTKDANNLFVKAVFSVEFGKK